MFFSVISSAELGQFWWNLVHRFPNKFASKWCNRVSHLTWIMSLYYRETWKCSSDTCYPWVVTERLQNLSHLNCESQIRQIWIQSITGVWGLLQERYKIVSLTCTNWNGDWEQSGAIRTRAGICSHCGSYSLVALLIVPEQWCVFRIPSLATFPTGCYQLDSNLANLEATVEVG